MVFQHPYSVHPANQPACHMVVTDTHHISVSLAFLHTGPSSDYTLNKPFTKMICLSLRAGCPLWCMLEGLRECSAHLDSHGMVIPRLDLEVMAGGHKGFTSISLPV